jgi:hypothetical protein
MGGKAILLVVIGFTIIFLTMGLNLNQTATRAVSNATDFYENNIAHDIAVSGANIGANQVFLDPTWTAGYKNLDYQGGTVNVSVEIVDAFKNIRRIISTGTFDGHTATVKITLQPSKFSKFGYYSVTEPPGIWWTTGDTVWGPFHTQDYIRISGDPVFMGKTTTQYGIQYDPSTRFSGGNNPEFNGGYEQGVNLPMPPGGVTDIAANAQSGGKEITGQSVVYLTFNGDNITYQYGNNGKPTTVPASQFAPNGVIYVDGADVRLKGTVSGKYTIAASSITTTVTTGKGKRKKTKTITQGGNVYLDGDVTYSSDPLKNPNSTDLLGIVAENNVYITDNAQNNNNINIDAAIYCQNGSFTAENYASRPASGTINLLGGITQYVRGPVGTFSINRNGGLSIVSGFNKSYRYDKRLMFSSPPSFPNTGSFEIVSWYE